MHARNVSLYVKSRALRDLISVIPSNVVLFPRLSDVERDSARFLGNPNYATSGITIKVPVKTILSLAFAHLTMSPRKITSKLYQLYIFK